MLDVVIDEVEDDDDVRVCVFAIPIRRSVEGVAFGREKSEARDWVVDVMWSSSSKITMLYQP